MKKYKQTEISGLNWIWDEVRRPLLIQTSRELSGQLWEETGSQLREYQYKIEFQVRICLEDMA